MRRLKKLLLGSSIALWMGCGAVCGDEKVEEAEGCDDGNAINADGCEADCSLPACGNGIVDPGELCLVQKNFATGDGVAGVSPSGVALVDFDGDGLLDIVTANVTSNDLSFLKNLGGGEFGALQVRPSGGDSPGFVIAADLQNNGGKEVICTNQNTDNVTVFNGLGSLPSVTVGDRPGALASGDFDGDGNQDVVISNFLGNSVSLLLNPDGSGIFSPAIDLPVGLSPLDIVVADVDEDGNQDILVVSGLVVFDGLVVLFGEGGGTFAAPIDLLGAVNVAGMVVADVDENGTQDILFIGFDGVDALALRILSGAGNRQFTLLPDAFPLGQQPRSPQVGDFNQDGLLDFAVSNTSADAGLSVLLGLGDEQFAPLVEFGTSSSGLQVGDLNGDTVLDFVMSEDLANEVEVFLSEP
jgi:cysteine-rich repeat protein